MPSHDDSINFACSYCGVQPGAECVDRMGRTFPGGKTFHWPRQQEAGVEVKPPPPIVSPAPPVRKKVPVKEEPLTLF